MATMALAEIEIAANELEAAAMLIDPVVGQFETAVGAEHPRVAEALVVQGKVALRRGEPVRAASAFERAATLRADGDPLALNAARVLWAQAAEAAGDHAQAARAAKAVDVEHVEGPELRGWCEPDCAALVVSLRDGDGG